MEELDALLGKLNRIPKQYYYELKEPAYRFVSDKKARLMEQPMWAIDLAVGLVALVSLVLMSGHMFYVWAAILTGILAFFFDYVVEYAGIVNGKWEYPRSGKGFMNVPLEVPLMFFFGGILATFLLFVIMETGAMVYLDMTAFDVLTLPQVFLIVLAAVFMVQYFTGRIKSLMFWALPLGLAAYISFPEPWLLVLSIIPVYIDYYLEKRLVPSNDISYEGYDEDVAINVAVSYFTVALLVFVFSYAVIQFLS